MLFQALNKIKRILGITSSDSKGNYVNISALFSNDNSYSLHAYTAEDGSFDYEKYRKVQEAGNKKKLNAVWVLEENIEFLSTYITKTLKTEQAPTSELKGICHGTRRGKEQEWFNKYLRSDNGIIGTEISDTASQFPNTIQWDFHETKKEWLESIDFIYSNSFDHSYSPEECLNTWMSCLKKGGLCILEHTDLHGEDASRELDPFGAHILQMPILISKWGREKYGVREILKAPKKSSNVQFNAFIVIEKY